MKTRSFPVGATSMTLRKPTILVVEDEILIRIDLAETLREQGYTVLEAGNGDEALKLLQAGIACDLVISDVRMPGGTDGLALLARLKIDRPDVPVILASGHLSTERAAAATAFLSKPYPMAQMLAMVAKVIGPGGNSLDRSAG